jgi:GTP-binding protein EngB required for normal cell division
MSKEQDKFNTQYSNVQEIDIVGSKSIFSFFKSEFSKLEGSLKIENFKILEIVKLKDLKLTNLKINDCYKLNKVELSELQLTNLEISGCSQLKQITGISKLPKLMSLSVRNCRNLTKLDCSSTKTLTELEVSDLIELNCSNTLIEELSLNLCPDIQKIFCSNNKKLNNLDVSNCKKLESLDCTGSKLTSLDLSYCPKNIIVKPSDLKITREKEKINILIVGRTGGGKSTLANVLTNTDNFKTSAYAISQTKNFNKREFEWNGKGLRIVDTIGVGDTKLSTKNTLFKITEGILSMPEGINQVLYVIDGRFTDEEINTFELIRDSIFNSGILNYVTIVRTKFSNFRNSGECETDIRKMREEKEIIAEIIKSCYGVIHVDNPPIDLVKEDDDDDYESQIAVNKNARKKSRKKILDYLEEKYHKENFKSEDWDKLCNKIVEYIRNNNIQELEIDPDILKLSEELCSIL